MDNLRGQFPDHDGLGGFQSGDEWEEDETDRELPPVAVGQDERRMQVRAYNFWAGLLGGRRFPAVDNIRPESLQDFGPYGVLLDFTAGIDNPGITHLGAKLAEECGIETIPGHLGDVPDRSLLSRITDHYMQIIANQAPIGFEAEFVNQRDETVLYRGILLPFSSDDETIDFIYGVINWKELADQQIARELMLEIGRSLAAGAETERDAAPLAEWADGPAETDDILDLKRPESNGASGNAFPSPDFGRGHNSGNEGDCIEFALSEHQESQMELADCLASARELARLAKSSEDRSHQALYEAIGQAYDFAIAAADAPEEFREMAVSAGLTVQLRAPMTPLVKLVFGADYDKTRLAEYALALCHAQRLRLGRGELADYLASAPGGLKGIVAEERRLRRAENGMPEGRREIPRDAILRKLRRLDTHLLSDVSREGNEFTVLVARRLLGGEVVLLGEVGGDAALLERAAKHLLS